MSDSTGVKIHESVHVKSNVQLDIESLTYMARISQMYLKDPIPLFKLTEVTSNE